MPEPEQQGSPGPGHSPPTHTTHTFDVPYKAGMSFTPTSADAEPRKPAHIDPIPRIALGDGSSPQAPSQSEQRRAQRRQTAGLAEGLEGKYVDEFGNVLDWDGTVKGRVEGDLPSMVGRPVSANGDVLAEGQVVGHVSENHDQPPLKELDGGLRVDDMGNIYSADGGIIGKLNEPPKKADEPQEQEQEKQPEADKKKPCGCSAPQPASAPRPSEIYLDVKSTFDGIQIILKIPTIFNQVKQEQHRQENKREASTSTSTSSEQGLADEQENEQASSNDTRGS
ncbi:uncharacterized protein F5Z01DRAFT_656447 [Emericellopsis atlantica]|uniref:LEA domain protein n=1 Tax=Emericellopsis atlantica TaxID=2614577 RepID=A0A9P7ZKJ2_9HYPO|nr:uncharacterized protein F5Z01DRAFT_656447 [Emericellopsis atlantica]KAG9253690.1 hypothetical protein F5Z01DRAFT_656447 [Emericellopsis atlantica]